MYYIIFILISPIEGFDSIGIAVDLWSELSLEISDRFGINVDGNGASNVPLDNTNLVCVGKSLAFVLLFIILYEGVAAAFALAGKSLPCLQYSIRNEIPYARGLGSSSAAVVSGLVAGSVLAGKLFSYVQATAHMLR